MAEDTETKSDMIGPSRARRFRDWLMRPRTVRVVAPAVFLLGVAFVAIGLLFIPSGDDATPAAAPPGVAPGPDGVSATAYAVPPELVAARTFLVPPVQPFAGFMIEIDSLGVEAMVVRLGLDPRDVPQVPNDGKKVAWYEFTSKPGKGSNAVLSGHVRWAGDPGVFADLDELEEGDAIRLLWTNGEETVYEVSTNLLLDADDPELLEAMGPTPEDTITLITCGGTWVTDLDNPLGGDFTDRVVIQARLVEPSAAALSPLIVRLLDTQPS
jgi:LPXTG-site transpeptidase (sortase) family protein